MSRKENMQQSQIHFATPANISFSKSFNQILSFLTKAPLIKFLKRLTMLKITVLLLLLSPLTLAQNNEYSLYKLEHNNFKHNNTAITSFGSVVDISFNKAVVGASLAYKDQGILYIFNKKNNIWKQEAELLLDNSNFFDQASISAAIDNNTVVAGLPWQDTKNNTAQGTVYIFERKDSWQQVAELTPEDGQAEDLFGSSVAISGNTIIVGAQRSKTTNGIAKGAAYIFTKQGKIWQQASKLQASTGKAFDDFGNAVAIDGNIAIVAAKSNEVNGETARGSVYVYKKQGDKWNLAKTLIARDGKSGDKFGSSIAIANKTIVVGAESYTYGNQVSQGAAYIFKLQNNRLNSNKWEQVAKLIAQDGKGGDHFGSSVDINGNKVVVGAYLDNIDSDGYFQGSTYIFEESLGVWEQSAKLTAENGNRGDNFGNSVAVSTEAIIVGAYSADVNGKIDQGTVYTFNTPLLEFATMKTEPPFKH